MSNSNHGRLCYCKSVWIFEKEAMIKSFLTCVLRTLIKDFIEAILHQYEHFLLLKHYVHDFKTVLLLETYHISILLMIMNLNIKNTLTNL